MSLPEKPLTRRETYLAKAAGQDVTLPDEDITREELYLRAIAEGGGGGGVTPEYVAEAIAEAKTEIEAEIPTKTSDLTNDSGYAAIDDTTAAQNKTYSSAKVEEKVAGEEITTTATGTDLTLSTAAGNINALTVYGKSEVVDGAIVSAGEGGSIEVQTSGKNLFGGNYNEIYQILIPANTTFTISTSKPQSGEYPRIRAYDKSETIIDYWNINNERNSRYYRTFTLSYDVYYVQIYSTTVSDIQLEFNTTMTAYEPYNGTMAVFETGTPLYGVSDTVRDVMQWDGSSGEVTNNCNVLNMGGLNWNKTNSGIMYSQPITNIKRPPDRNTLPNIVNPIYTPDTDYNMGNLPTNKTIAIGNDYRIYVYDTDYTDTTDFKNAMSGVMLVYELATPTTEQLTTAENASIAGLRTFEPQTHAQNNAGAAMTVEAYAGTANGQAVADLKTKLQITQSDTLTLTTAGWSNNAQVIAYAHDTSKRNVIDVAPASVEEWASCGVMAISETATGITFKCSTVPENALSFKVTSMGVN